VIEVLSPDDRPSEMRRKTAEYLDKGVPLVVVVDPKRATATIFRPAGEPVILRDENAVLDLSDVIPGFRLRPVGRLRVDLPNLCDGSCATALRRLLCDGLC